MEKGQHRASGAQRNLGVQVWRDPWRKNKTGLHEQPLPALLQRRHPERGHLHKKYKQYKKSSSRDGLITNYKKLDML